jgi:hypothetical protein
MAKQPEKYSAVPAGVDPVDLDYPMDRASCSGCLGKMLNIMLYVLAAVGIFSVVMSQRPPVPIAISPTPTPTEIIVPTPTLARGLDQPPIRRPTPTAPAPPTPVIDLAVPPDIGLLMSNWQATYESLYQPQPEPTP